MDRRNLEVGQAPGTLSYAAFQVDAAASQSELARQFTVAAVLVARARSMVPHDRHAALLALEMFLSDAFTADELRHWATRHLPPRVTVHLPGEISSLATLVHVTVNLLDRQDLLDDGIFAALTEHRPARAADIEHLRAQLAGAPRQEPVELRSLRGRLRRWMNPTIPTHTRDPRARAHVLRLVRMIWIDGYLEHALRTLPWIDLDIRHRADLVHHGLPLLDDEPATVEDTYELARGNLLLLGDPGAGKTITLLTLARTRLAAAEQDDCAPLPVVFNLSSWTPDRSLDRWLVDELNTSLCIPRQTATRWLSADSLVLFLDGLDEVLPRHRGKCIAAIDEFRRNYLIPVAVCTRTGPYTAESARLTLERAVELLPLSTERAATILPNGPVHDPSLQGLTTSPLMLGLMAGLPDGPGRKPDRNHSLGERREALLASFLDRMLARSKDPRFPPDKLRGWLRYLSHNMTWEGVSELRVERMQPSWLPRTRSRLLFLCVSLSLICLANSLTTAYLASELVLPEDGTDPVGDPGADEPLPTGLIVLRVILAVVTTAPMLLVQAVRRRLTKIEAYDGIAWSWDAWARSVIKIMFWTGGLLTVYSALVLFVFHSSDPDSSQPRLSIPVYGLMILIISLAAGVLLGPIGGLVPISRPGTYSRHSWLVQTFKQAALSACASALPFLVVGAVLWLPQPESSSGEPDTILVVFIFVFMVANLTFFFRGGDTLIQHATLRVLLTTTRVLPWRLYAFLDHCVDLSLLRRVGNGYMFMHHSFQEHLAGPQGERK